MFGGKRSLLFMFCLMVTAASVAQAIDVPVVWFEDDFESYADNTRLRSAIPMGSIDPNWIGGTGPENRIQTFGGDQAVRLKGSSGNENPSDATNTTSWAHESAGNFQILKFTLQSDLAHQSNVGNHLYIQLNDEFGEQMGLWYGWSHNVAPRVAGNVGPPVDVTDGAVHEFAMTYDPMTGEMEWLYDDALQWTYNIGPDRASERIWVEDLARGTNDYVWLDDVVAGTTSDAYTLVSMEDGPFHAATTWDDGVLVPGVGTRTIVQDYAVTVAQADTTDSLLVHQDGKLIVDDGNTLSVDNDVEVIQASLEIAPTGQLDVSGPVTFGAGSQLVMGMADDAMGGIVADEVTIDDNSSLKLAISGKAPFKGGFGHHVLISTRQEFLSGDFWPISPDLTQYTRYGAGPVYNVFGELTLDIMYDLHSGDANLDTVTDVRDFNVWNANKFTSNPDWTAGDFTGDGQVDVRDFNAWNAAKFTSVEPLPPWAEGQVPEPGSLALLVAGAVVLAACARRRRGQDGPQLGR